MNQMKLMPILGLLAIGIPSLSIGQVKTLPEVTVVARNYKYLKAVNNSEAAEPVKILERRAAAFDIKNSEYYNDEYDSYDITFYLPDGYVLAVYDQEGKLLRTAERFKNTAIPLSVRKAVATRYPNWGITKDVYKVQYEESGSTKFEYKLTLQNGDKRLRVKTTEQGEFL